MESARVTGGPAGESSATRAVGPRTFALVGATALAIRVAYVTAGAARRLPLSDALWYHLEAALISHGHGFVNPFVTNTAGARPATAAHPPLYPLLLAAASKVGASSVRAEEFVGAAIGALTVLVTARVAGDLCGPRAALTAGMLAALSPALWVTDGGLLSEGLLAFVVAAALALTVRQFKQPTRWGPVAIGAMAGLAALTRAEAILLVPPLAVFAAISSRRVGRPVITPVVGVVLAAALVVAPWIVRNLVTFDRPVTLSTGDGTLAGSNCLATYQGPALGGWLMSCYPLAPPGDESVVTAFWRDQGLSFAEHHLAAQPRVVAARLGREWSVFRPMQAVHNERDDGRPFWSEMAAVAAFWAVILPAGAGFVRLWDRRLELSLLLVPAVVTSIAAVATWGAVRFRAPAEAPLLMLAGVGLAGSRPWPRARRESRPSSSHGHHPDDDG